MESDSGAGGVWDVSLFVMLGGEADPAELHRGAVKEETWCGAGEVAALAEGA